MSPQPINLYPYIPRTFAPFPAHRLSILLLIILTISATNAEPEHILFFLHRGETQCFTSMARARTKISGEVRVTNGRGDMEVGFRLAVASTNKPLLDKKVVDHEKFTARAPTGPHHGHDEISTPAEYKLCVFSSEHSKGVPSDYRKVYISFAVSKGVDSFEDDEGALKGLARESHVGEMERRIHEMQRLVSDVVEEIDLIRDREGDMFVITDDLNRQIWIMGVMSCMAILVTGFLQMYQTRVDLTKHSSNLRGAKSLSREGSKRMTKQGSFHMPKLTRDGSIGRVLNLAKDRNVLPRSLSGHRSAKGTQRDVLLTGQSSEST